MRELLKLVADLVNTFFVRLYMKGKDLIGTTSKIV